MSLQRLTAAEKADIAVSNLISTGGYLNPEQENRFIRKVQDQPTVLKSARRVMMSGPKREINKIGFGSRILRRAPASGSALNASERAAPTTEKITLTTTEIIAEVHIPYDVIEDNIERGSLEGTIMSMIAERSAIDLEELMLLGNTGSADSYLSLFNGAIAWPPSHIADVAGAGSGFDKSKFKTAIQNMPSKYLRNRSAMRFYVSPNNETEYRDQVADRQTTLGDNTLEGYRPVFAYGVPVVPAVMMPDTQMMLVDPMNLIWGVQRKISIEAARDIRARVIIIVLTLRVAFAIEEADAVVLIDNIGVA